MQGIKQLAWSSVKVLAGPTAANAPVLTAIPAQVASQFFALGQRAYMQGFDNGSTQFAAFETALQSLGDVSDVGISNRLRRHGQDGRLGVHDRWEQQRPGQDAVCLGVARILRSAVRHAARPAQPHYSKDDHNLSKADFSNFWALLQPGQPVEEPMGRRAPRPRPVLA